MARRGAAACLRQGDRLHWSASSAQPLTEHRPTRPLPPRAEWRERKGLGGGMDMNVTVLTTGFWPTYKVGGGRWWAGCARAGGCAACALPLQGGAAKPVQQARVLPPTCWIDRLPHHALPPATALPLQQLEVGLPDVMMQGLEQYTQVGAGGGGAGAGRGQAGQPGRRPPCALQQRARQLGHKL